MDGNKNIVKMRQKPEMLYLIFLILLTGCCNNVRRTDLSATEQNFDHLSVLQLVPLEKGMSVAKYCHCMSGRCVHECARERFQRLL